MIVVNRLQQLLNVTVFLLIIFFLTFDSDFWNFISSFYCQNSYLCTFKKI